MRNIKEKENKVKIKKAHKLKVEFRIMDSVSKRDGLKDFTVAWTILNREDIPKKLHPILDRYSKVEDRVFNCLCAFFVIKNIDRLAKELGEDLELVPEILDCTPYGRFIMKLEEESQKERVVKQLPQLGYYLNKVNVCKHVHNKIENNEYVSDEQKQIHDRCERIKIDIDAFREDLFKSSPNPPADIASFYHKPSAIFVSFTPNRNRFIFNSCRVLSMGYDYSIKSPSSLYIDCKHGTLSPESKMPEPILFGYTKPYIINGDKQKIDPDEDTINQIIDAWDKITDLLEEEESMYDIFKRMTKNAEVVITETDNYKLPVEVSGFDVTCGGYKYPSKNHLGYWYGEEPEKVKYQNIKGYLGSLMYDEKHKLSEYLIPYKKGLSSNSFYKEEYKAKVFKGIYMDINSFYPSEVEKIKYPINLEEVENFTDYKDYDYVFGFFKITAKLKKKIDINPFYGLSNINNAEYPVDSNLLDVLFKYYNVKDLKPVKVFKSKTSKNYLSFSKPIINAYLTKQRIDEEFMDTELTEEAAAERERAKLEMNSLIGNFGADRQFDNSYSVEDGIIKTLTEGETVTELMVYYFISHFAIIKGYMDRYEKIKKDFKLPIVSSLIDSFLLDADGYDIDEFPTQYLSTAKLGDYKSMYGNVYSLDSSRMFIADFDGNILEKKVAGYNGKELDGLNFDEVVKKFRPGAVFHDNKVMGQYEDYHVSGQRLIENSIIARRNTELLMRKIEMQDEKLLQVEVPEDYI